MRKHKLQVAVALVILTTLTACSSPSPSIESYGSLNDPIDNTVKVTPGKYEVTLPFTLKNLSHDPTVYNIRLEPGQEGTINVILYEITEGNLHVQLMPKIEIR